MRRSVVSVVLVLGLLACAGCASSGGSSGERAKARAIKTPDEEVPAPVKAIEAQINRRAAIIADEVEIHCSKNYEWDVALMGDVVTPQKAEGGEQVSIAEGHARATFRQLEIRAHRRIVFRRSGFGVVPFIRVSAAGSAAYAEAPEAGSPPNVRRARLIRIENAEIHVVDEQPPVAGTAGSGPADGLAAPAGLRNQ